MPPAGNQYLQARYRWIPEHGYLLSIGAARFAELEWSLAGSSICSQSIPKIPTSARRRDMLCLISAKKGYLTHVARSIVYYEAESGRDKLDIWNVSEFESPVPTKAIKKKIEGMQAWRALRAMNGGFASPAAFALIMKALRHAAPDAATTAEALIDRSLPAQDTSPTNARINWAYHRDAIVTSLEMAGIPKDQLKAKSQLDQGSSDDVSSIFDTDEDVTTIEDLAILQDLDNTNEDWRFVKRQHYPAKTFTNGETKLTVILANKLPLERQLGVDLIYVNETLGSVVFVQYKMFSGVDGEGGYRPNEQLGIEIARMDAATAQLSAIAADESCNGYRLGSDPFFLKFCSKLLSHETAGHVPGIYVPLSFWKRLIKAQAGKGAKGGTVVYAATFGRRYITPTHFIDMVDRGWVGTTALQTAVIASYLKEMLKGERGVVLAVKSLVPLTASENDEDENDIFRRPNPKLRKTKYPGKKPK